MVGSLVVGATVVAQGAAAAAVTDPPDWVDDLAGAPAAGPESPPVEEPEGGTRSLPQPPADDTEPLPAPELPEPGAWEVTLAGEGRAGEPEGRQDPPVDVAAAAGGFAGDRLEVEVLDHGVADRAGVSGFVFGVSEAPEGEPEGAGASETEAEGVAGGDGDGALSQAAVEGEAIPAELAVDYSGFAEAFGGSYADRLRVVALPDCVLVDPRPEGCETAGAPIPTRNDREAERLVVEVDDLAGLAAEGVAAEGVAGEVPAQGAPADSDVAAAGTDGVLFAVTAGVNGEEGAWAATPISSTGQWQVSPGSGEFSYTYDLDVPAPAGGDAPTVALSYSSGAMDGLTNASNTQAPPTGLGWSQFDGAFIERRYQPCVDTHLDSEDLCWMSFNATISLNGVAGPLIPMDGTNNVWRVANDPGWRVERLTGAANGEGGAAGAGGDQGEHWKVTATDGTQYFFGLGNNPDTSTATNSVATVPVFADVTGEPCFGNVHATFGICDQAWRWGLDRVVDPDGNVTTYYYDRGSNRYGALNGFFQGRLYNRSLLLNRIEYGARQGTGAGSQSTARVEFGRHYRCVRLNDTCTTAPSDDTNTTGEDEPALFPDVPADLICSTSSCTAHAPSFFDTSRYANITTSVRVGPGAEDWRGVDHYTFDHDFGSRAGSPQKLVLRSIQRVGLSDPNQIFLPQPPTEFEFTWLDNRVDIADVDGRVPMPHPRVSAVINEFGGRVDVTYGQNRPCERTYVPPLWHDNVRDCFPQTITDRDGRRTGVFNKYLVTQVTETADALLTNPMTTSYTYEENPAWAFNYGSFAQYDDKWGWSNWRGYGTTLITQGASKTRVRVFRGLEGDPLWIERGGGIECACGHREASVQALDTPTRTFTDYPSLAGRVLQEASLGTLDGTANTILQSTLHEYERRMVLDRAPGFLDVEWGGISAVTESMATAPSQFRRQRTTTTYTQQTPTAPPQAATSQEEGWLEVTGDERCSRTTYANNPTSWMWEYPASNVTVAGNCSSTQEVSVSETYYDNSTTLGAAPTRGNPTRERTKLTGSTWATTSTGYDALGRPVSVTDANNATTTTTHTASPSHAIPTRTVVTNPLLHTQTTDWLPERQVPTREQDANGNVTTYRYDGVGRLTRVALPTEQQAGMIDNAPSWQFIYNLDPEKSARPSVQSRQLTAYNSSTSQATYEDTWLIYDRLGREWQTHQRSPQSGRVLVTETAYDNRGLVLHKSEPQAVSGTPGQLLLVPTWDNRTRSAYDELGRELRQEWMRGDTVARTTEFAYTADTVTVTGPDEDKVRETVDGLGRTTAVAEHDGDSAWVTSTYTYDMADNLRTITDPANNVTTYTYDLAGRRLTQDDPDRGVRTFTYDPGGNQTSVTDGSGNAVHTKYDALARPTERRSGSPTGPLLASWTYDGTGRLGLPRRTTTYAEGREWYTEVTGYDQRSRPLGTLAHVPTGIAGLAGDYTTSQAYDRADRVTSTTYPAVGGLPQETVTTTYNTLGLPTAMSSPLAPYVRTTTYDNRGRLTGAAFGAAASGGTAWMARSWSYNNDQQLATTETFVAGSSSPNGIVGRHELTYDPTGNLSSKTTVLNGQDWRECFEHDARQRLTRSYTVDIASTCTAGTPGTGDQPYENRFSYHPDGRIQARTDVINPTWGDMVLYDYPAAGSDQPHAPTSVGGDTYEWDANGNLVERTVGGETETFTWDAQHQLTSIAGPDGTTSFVYDAGGQRVLRRTPAATTLYVAGHEVTANATGTTVNAVRSYSFEGQLVATRNPSGVSYMVADEADSVEMAIPSGGQPNASRSYEPFGQVRDESGDMATDQGFVGQVEDSSTKLSYLQNRYYDTTTGVFTSADPLYDTSSVKSLNPYVYGMANPTTMSDPNGLSPTYIHGLEEQNFALEAQNKQLRSHIKRLGNHIEDLQSIIKKQRRYINKLITRIRAMDRIIRQQQSIIRRLVNRVNYLVGVVNYQRAVIGRLQAKIAWQQSVINRQARIISYQRGVIVQLVGLAFRPGYQAPVLASIFAGRGIPSTRGSWRDLAIAQAATIQMQGGTIAALARTSLNNWMSNLRLMGDFGQLREDYNELSAQFGELAASGGSGGRSGMDIYCDAVTVAGWAGDIGDVAATPVPPTDVVTDVVDGATVVASTPCAMRSGQNLVNDFLNWLG